LRGGETGPYRARMTWASHPTREMPPSSAIPTGRHRRRRPITIGIIAFVVVVAGLVVVALTSPDLIGLGSTTPRPQLILPPTPIRPAPSTTDSGLVSTTATGDPASTPSGGTASLEDQVVTATNAQRATAKCAALIVDDRLRTAAQVHAADMASYAYLSHTGHDGSDPAARIIAAGYKIDSRVGWAENVARGYPTVDTVMAAFMSSTDNKANILNCSLKAVGVGVARSVAGELYWTQDFGSVANQP
jgi:uncharacterized protein YkwD